MRPYRRALRRLTASGRRLPRHLIVDGGDTAPWHHLSVSPDGLTSAIVFTVAAARADGDNAFKAAC